jgi:hypothetical protein
MSQNLSDKGDVVGISPGSITIPTCAPAVHKAFAFESSPSPLSFVRLHHTQVVYRIFHYQLSNPTSLLNTNNALYRPRSLCPCRSGQRVSLYHLRITHTRPNRPCLTSDLPFHPIPMVYRTSETDRVSNSSQASA